MGLRFYNTLTRSLTDFTPAKANRVTIFACGPTVYDVSHVGHGKTYAVYDMIARFLKFLSFSVFYVMNITDIDDKILSRAREMGTDPLALAAKYSQEFQADMKALGIDSVNLYASATEHIPEIIGQIEGLLQRGTAYRLDGDVYYDISKFPEYGKLSGQKLDQLRVHRVDPDPRKKNPGDFVLWKSQKPGEIAWDSPWGKGRPGWHIEDTAITLTYFGPTYDIHGGGTELVFPHHEAEIAQAEALTGKKPLARFWLHSGLLHIKGQEMHKSLGNFVPLREVLDRYHPETLRLFYASTHYRSPVDFSEDRLKQAQSILNRIHSTVGRLKRELSSPHTFESPRIEAETERLRQRFVTALEDDFNTPQAIAELIALVNLAEKGSPTGPAASKLLGTIVELGSILGLFWKERIDKQPMVNRLVELLLELRQQLRSRGDYQLSDEIRKRMTSLGVQVEDTEKGPVWTVEASTPEPQD